MPYSERLNDENSYTVHAIGAPRLTGGCLTGYTSILPSTSIKHLTAPQPSTPFVRIKNLRIHAGNRTAHRQI